MMASPAFEVGGRRIGPDEPAYVVAELSANHRGDYGRAVALIEAAAGAGADAVKLQTYTADTLTIDCDNACFRIGGDGLWAGRTLYDLYREAATPWEWQPRLRARALDLGLELFSSPFDETAVAFLEEMDVPAHKIASFELIDTPLLRAVAATGKPVIVSTGMASLDEVDEAVGVLREAGAGPIALLKCTSAYPAPPEEMNLRSIPYLADRFGVVAGVSDHTRSEAVAVAAVAVGGRIVEKHLTLSRSEGGPDAAFSAEPAEFARMVAAVRDAERALGAVSFGGAAGEKDLRPLRRSLFVVADIKAGEPFTPDNVRSIRPGHGLAPKHLDKVLGQRAAADIPRGTPLTWEMIAR
ncbi:MAG: pseudaminic acid synthase [Candidatus Hydrogenedentes bacterium]|nr:pseudaminic acid synthase [Candidatus Hydrogenedentota bacterium]